MYPMSNIIALAIPLCIGKNRFFLTTYTALGASIDALFIARPDGKSIHPYSEAPPVTGFGGAPSYP
jgi:hypothetical protein